MNCIQCHAVNVSAITLRLKIPHHRSEFHKSFKGNNEWDVGLNTPTHPPDTHTHAGTHMHMQTHTHTNILDQMNKSPKAGMLS